MYIDFINTFKSIADEINPNGTFCSGGWADLNRYINEKPLPQIFAYPFKVAPINKNYALDNASNILLVFVFQDSPNSNDIERDAIINEADTMQRAFRSKLDELDLEYTNYEAEPFFKQFSGVTSGMFVRFNMTLKVTAC